MEMVGRRIKYEAVERSPNEENDADMKKRRVFSTTCLWYSLRTVLLISIYFLPSIGLTFYQRWLFQRFRFPLSVVIVHLVVKYLLATVIRICLMYRQERQRIMSNWKDYLITISPIGIFSGIDIGFSNWGLELITISLYTMTKSSCVIFILGFAVLFKLEKKSWSLFFIILMISTGLFLFTYEATQFNALGFGLVMTAAVLSGLRWSFTQLLLQKSKMNMRNPVDMIYHMQPWMIVSVLPFAIVIEGIPLATNCLTFRNTDLPSFLLIVFKILFGAGIAFFMEFTEVMVVTYTSSLTLSIAGIFKEIIVLALAAVWNGDRMSEINAVGLLVCLAGIICHVIHKIQSTHFNSLSRFNESEVETLGVDESLINNDSLEHLDISSDSDVEKSDTQILFDILNRRERE